MELEPLSHRVCARSPICWAKRMPRKIFSVVRFALNSYRQHWIAAPAGAIASLISTLSAATLMMLFSPIIQLTVGSSSAIFANAVIGPLTAYAIYLSTYYCLMYLKERRSLFDESGTLVAERLSGWFRVVKYD